MRGFDSQGTTLRVEKKLEEFVKQFNRLNATRRYVDAFSLCTSHLNSTYKEEVKKMAEMVVPKLTNLIEVRYEMVPQNQEENLIDKNEVTQDVVIDMLASLGYKMKINGERLKVSTAYISVENISSKTIISSKCAYPRILLCILCLFVFYLLACLIFSCLVLAFDVSKYPAYLATAGILIIPFIISIQKLYYLWSKKKVIIRKIATEIIKFI